jgi:hypothetical protein
LDEKSRYKGEVVVRNGLAAGIVVVFTIVLSYVLAFPLFTAHAQRATPEPVVERATHVPPTPTPIVIVIEESVSVGETSGNGVLDPITEDIAIEDSTSTINPINETIAIEDQVYVEPGMAPASQRAAEREKKSRDAFSRATGSVKESGEGSDNESLGAAGNAGSTWMVVVYVVIGLVAVALFGLLGRRLRRRMQD